MLLLHSLYQIMQLTLLLEIKSVIDSYILRHEAENWLFVINNLNHLLYIYSLLCTFSEEVSL